MARKDLEWRFLRSWSQGEIKERLAELSSLSPSFEIGRFNPRKTYQFEKLVSVESFDRSKAEVASYRFSDPNIVQAHFDPLAPLLGRRMLLEIQVMGFHFLCGTVVSETLERENARESVFGFRYDTLDGHIESGTEWFILREDHKTGEVSFRIQAKWCSGNLPTWWSKIGFRLLASRYQRKWHHLAFQRLCGKSKRNDLLIAISLGAIAGMRSMSAPALLAHRRRLKHERLLEALALFEMAADKTAYVPNRIAPLPLLVRGVSGAVTASTASEAEQKSKRRMLALLGAASAVASAFGTYYLRRLITRKFRVKDNVLGLIEDAAVLKARTALSRKIS